MNHSRSRFRDLGINPGIFPTGKHNSIVDVADVRVGHCTVVEGDDVRTGATTILPHGGNLFQAKVPAGLFVGNGYGKLMGSTQLAELGEIETPLLLTNTTAVGEAFNASIEWTWAHSENAAVGSINAIVGETNDGYLNNLRRRALTREHFLTALADATTAPPAEGCVGAGTGTIAFHWKGGIGTSSRVVPGTIEGAGGYTVGALVQSNYGGVLQMAGIAVGQRLEKYYLKEHRARTAADGSIMIVLATDAPLSDRNLTRLAARAMAGLARTGAAMSNGSGDYAIAFSTHPDVRRTPDRRSRLVSYPELSNDQVSPLFLAAIEATEEAIYNSLCAATTTTGYKGTIEALPLDVLQDLLP